MTLLASERSLLIRNKFRSVLQLRIQNRRQNEINADSGLKSACPSEKAEKEQGEALRLSDDGVTQMLPPGGLKPESGKERSVSGFQRQKKARQSQDLCERIQHPPGPPEQRFECTVAQENAESPCIRTSSFPLSTDVFENDISSCSSSPPTEQHAVHQSPAFSPISGLSGDQLLSDFSAVGPPINLSPDQSGLALLPATESIRQTVSVTLGESNSMATTGRANGMYLTSQTTPLLPKTARAPSPSRSSSHLLPAPLPQLQPSPPPTETAGHQT
ncbi:myocardin-like [Thalassophryne amazonica]|uniref:myocardin-like n=1 Tax=Thalassophryne amazonica TaxID=390379 RepID=UPI00147205DC|nr:myocardin-like [Thalassophryne amazonica]